MMPAGTIAHLVAILQLARELTDEAIKEAEGRNLVALTRLHADLEAWLSYIDKPQWSL
jgi:hypothetical protein